MRQVFLKAVFGVIVLSSGIYLGAHFNLLPTTPLSSTSSAASTRSDLVAITPTVQGAQDETRSDLVMVTRVIDGDTIEIEGRQRVRYIGIDTPETVDPRKPVQCYGREASDKNKELVAGKKVTLKKDVSETDKFGRLLRYVYAGNIFVNDYLVQQGFAHAVSYPPDIKYQGQFLQAEHEARENNRGLWAVNACSTTYAPTLKVGGPTSSNSDCTIKGNINSKGEKIYHMPGQRYYDKTQIDEGAGEHWFCTETEATGNGWRKSKV